MKNFLSLLVSLAVIPSIEPFFWSKFFKIDLDSIQEYNGKKGEVLCTYKRQVISGRAFLFIRIRPCYPGPQAPSHDPDVQLEFYTFLRTNRKNEHLVPAEFTLYSAETSGGFAAGKYTVKFEDNTRFHKFYLLSLRILGDNSCVERPCETPQCKATGQKVDPEELSLDDENVNDKNEQCEKEDGGVVLV